MVPIMDDAIGLLLSGGWFLVPIAIASVMALALFFDRVLYLRTDRIVPDEFAEAVRANVDDPAALRELCASEATPAARVLHRGLIHAGGDRAEMRESMEDAGRFELRQMKRNTGALAAIATVAPLLGLLGTVVGMISTFQAIVDSSAQGASAVDVGQLAGGIWQALMTTAAGLVVAIPVIIGHRFVYGRIERLLGTIEDLASRMLDHLTVSTAESPAPEGESA